VPFSSIESPSPAKVNLLLEVLGRREDGYHEIRTVMQRISLCDTLRISLKGERGITLTTTSDRLPVGEGNLAYQAASCLLEEAESRIGVEIHIEKEIPIAAGLGGGSSNAAGTLMGLNKIMNLNFSKVRLMEIGARIGADIPFFILEKSAIATGIGEKLQPVEIRPALWLVLVSPGWEISTRWAYEGLNLELTKRPIHITLPPFFKDVGEVIRILYNDLERVAVAAYPEINEIKAELLSHGAAGSLMTGSGPTVFGIFGRKRDAEMAFQRLIGNYAERRWGVYLTTCIS
jgi:4-diphosphocytidyl-2-C-methyl-D-erythritol kinase